VTSVTEQDVAEFLHLDKPTLISDMMGEVRQFLSHEPYFIDGYEGAFNSAFVKFVMRLLRQKVQERFQLNAQDAYVLLEDNIPEDYLRKDTYTSGKQQH
jgi:hypothetical protein